MKLMPSGAALNWRLVLSRLAAAGSLFSLALYTLWPSLPWGKGESLRTVVLYGFSVLGEAIEEGVFPAFQAEWLEETGERIELISSFAGSGTITNQLILGVPAELAILSLEVDALRLVEKGVLTGPTWRSAPHGGIVNRTPFIILVRPGNPKRIKDFEDLARPGVEIVHPDPLTSGGAQWAIVAEYGSALRKTGDPERAYEQLLGIWRNVVAQAASARAAKTQFENGFGDALITYEQEALWDGLHGNLEAEIVYPESTVLSEHTAVIIPRNIPDNRLELVEAFLAFLQGEEAQRLFVERGFRSVVESLNRGNESFGAIKDPFLVEDLGGWERVRKEIVEEIWKDRVLREVRP